jgi:hypothetical protein
MHYSFYFLFSLQSLFSTLSLLLSLLSITISANNNGSTVQHNKYRAIAVQASTCEEVCQTLCEFGIFYPEGLPTYIGGLWSPAKNKAWLDHRIKQQAEPNSLQKSRNSIKTRMDKLAQKYQSNMSVTRNSMRQ